MKKYLILILLFFVLGSKCFALEIVYPKTNPVKINSSSTFFIGSVAPGEKLEINGTPVMVSQLGAFAQIVSLSVGINSFKITSGYEVINFVIERPQPTAAAPVNQQFIEYPTMTFLVKKDNAPLRMTPVDGGINRMAHLPQGTQLFINGEKGDFYRIYLNSKLTGWVLKSDIQELGVNDESSRLKLFSKASIKNIKTSEEKDFCKYEIELDKKVPFILKEENGLTLQLFNIDGQEDNTYCLNIPMKKLMGYEAYYEDKLVIGGTGDKFILKIRKFPETSQSTSLKDIKIVIDAGHGGSEFGAIGAKGDKEKDINLAIAKALHKELESRGAKVFMTRDDDSDVSLQDRVKFAHDKDAALLISIHANALPDGADPIKNRGTSVYYYHNQAKSLAESILTAMTAQLGTQNDKVRQGSLALARPTSSVSVLIEVAYIINPDDYAMLLDKKFQANCAKAIADGVEKYLKN